MPFRSLWPAACVRVCAIATCLALGACADEHGEPLETDEWPETCNPAADGDRETRTFVLGGFVVPESNAVGFDLDGMHSTSALDVRGCNRVDGPDGIDNALPAWSRAALDLAGEQGSLDLASILGRSDIVLTITLTHWNGTADDDCLSAKLVRTSPRAIVSAERTTTASLSGSALSDASFGSLSLDLAFSFGDEPDDTTVYATTTLTELRARITFDSSMSRIVSPSIVGGVVPYLSGSTYERSFDDVLTQVLVAAKEPATDGILAVVPTFLDLEHWPAGHLSACDPRDAGTSANAFSFALLVEGQAIADR